jgi:hypothetical protein
MRTSKLRVKLNEIMMESMNSELNTSCSKPCAKQNQPKLFRNLKATVICSRSKYYKKLYLSLIPFLKEANLYDQLQKMVNENKFISGNKTTFDLAVYLIGKKFGVLVNRPSIISSFVIDGKKDKKIKSLY